MCAEVFHTLKKVVPATGVGGRGRLRAGPSKTDEDALKAMVEAIEKAGYRPGEDFMLGIDAACADWWDGEKKVYHLPKRGIDMTSAEMIDMYKGFCDRYPIISIEDPLGEDDLAGLAQLHRQAVGHRVAAGRRRPAGRHRQRWSASGCGIAEGTANAVLIKLNQIGTLSETLDAIQIAHAGAARTMPSSSRHRSGETEDTTIVDLTVAVNAGQIKTGAPSRTDRVAKYNQLLRIEDELFDVPRYLGKAAFFSIR
jgi:enolase